MPRIERLHLIVGLPRAGKSTLSRQLGFPIVETDAVRKALDCFPFVQSREPEVWEATRTMIKSLFLAGHTDVILDATSHTSTLRNQWVHYERVFHEVRTSPEECIKRALERDQDYLVPVIQEMAEELTWPLDTSHKIDVTGKATVYNRDYLGGK